MTTQSIALKPSEIRPIIDATFPEYRGLKASVRIQATWGACVNKLGASQITIDGKNALAALPSHRQIRL